MNASTLDVIENLNNYAAMMADIDSFESLATVSQNIFTDFLKVEFSSIYLYDPFEEKLSLLFATGLSKEQEDLAEKTVMERHPGWAFNNNKLLHIPDAENDALSLKVLDRKNLKILSRLYIPIQNKGEAIGVMSVLSSKKNGFAPELIALVQFIANVTGFIYKNLINFERIKNVRERMRLHDKALESSSNGIVITDALKKDNPIIYVNRAYQKITGYSRLESIGRNCRFLQGEDVNQTEVKRLKESIKNQAPCSVLLRNYKKDGTLFWNELSISPIHDYNGVTTHFIGIQTDVTERKNTEIKLEESNNRFGALIENLQAGLMVEDENRKISLVNQEFCDMFGIPAKPQQMIGYDCALASEEAKKAFVDEDMFINKITKILKEKKPVRFEEYELKDGRVFERDYIPIFVSENYKGHLWQYRDVTEKKNSEKELKKLKHFYEKVLNDLPGQIAVFDKDFRYLYLNPASVKNDEIRLWLVGKNDFEYCEYRGFETKIAEDRTKRLTMVSERKEPIRFEEIINKPDGGENYFIRVISPILDDNGTVQQLLAYGLDITDLKLAEREVQTARKQLENVLDATAEGIVTIDERSKIVMVNNEVENIWGYSKAELIGQPVTILMHTKFHDMHMNGMNRYLETRVPRVLNQKLELEGMRKNGEEFPINITIKETKLDDRLLFTAAIHDTTELKSLLKKLENSNKSLSEFAYIASHDLREPLRKITAFGELLNESLEGNIEEDDAENLKLMVDGANRMQKMINDLLSYSKITSTVEEHSKIDLKKLVDELADFELAALIEESNAKIEFGKNLGPVRGENTQIKQLFQNIISNGIKYRKPDIDPIIEITMDSGPRFYTVKIKDNGIGIKEEYYNQIFEMFKRLHSREEYSGTGIGLSVCKRIVEISGGKIGVESTVGEGSTFWFELPKVN